MEAFLNSGAIWEVLSILTVVALFVWRVPTKRDLERLDGKIDQLRSDMNERFAKQDTKFEKQDEKIDQLRSDMNERFAKQDEKIDQLRSDMNGRFAKQDEKIDQLRLEIKSDLQRVEDRANEANQFHARSVELLDAIRRELEERRERL